MSVSLLLQQTLLSYLAFQYHSYCCRPDSGKCYLKLDPAEDDYAVTAYQIYANGELVGARTLSADGSDSLEYLVMGLSGNTIYNFQIRAVDAAGNESNGGPVLEVTTSEDTIAPVWLQESTITATNLAPESLALSWTAASDDVGVDKYNIYQDGELLGEVTGSNLTYNVTGLTGILPIPLKWKQLTPPVIRAKAYPSARTRRLIQLIGVPGLILTRPPGSLNVNVEGDQVNNKVTYDQVSSEIKFVWSFAKELADTYRQNITLKKKADGTPVALSKSVYLYGNIKRCRLVLIYPARIWQQALLYSEYSFRFRGLG